jgi:two-component system, NarL family, sensor histidine kinase DevS
VDGSVASTRLRSLVEAGVALTSELSLDGVLQRLVEASAELTGAAYAALGVIAPGGSRLERFVVHGIDAETQAAMGELPQGHGILGALIGDARPLRLEDLTDDPRSVGFPPNHPPMRSFLGVPILLRGVAFGNLYLTEKAGGLPFSSEDEEIVTLLAAQAAVAVENARLYEAATRWSTRLQSLNEVGNALANETDLDRLLDLTVSRLRELLDARFVAVLFPDGPDELRFAAVAGEDGRRLLGQTIGRSGSKSGRVLAERRSERVDSMVDDPEVDQRLMRGFPSRAGLWVPLVVNDRPIGVLVAHDRLGSPDLRFTDDDLRLAETFASRAALAVDLSERVARDAFRRVVAAQELERRRLARELHDETGQALTSILLGLRALEDTLDDDVSHTAVARIRDLAVSTLQDVRRLAVELRPKALDDFGLVAALERLTETWSSATAIPVHFTAGLDGAELSSEVSTALYRIVQESLTNVVKHAHARHVSIVLTRKNGGVVVLIEDDGDGFDPTGSRDSFGIAGMHERVALIDGRLRIESAPGAGTTLVVEIPSG